LQSSSGTYIVAIQVRRRARRERRTKSDAVSMSRSVRPAPDVLPFDLSIEAASAPFDPARGPVAVFIVSDIRLLREGLAQLIAASPHLHVVGIAADVEAAIHASGTVCLDLVLLDTSTRDVRETAGVIRRALPGVPVVAFAVEDSDAVLACVEAGVAGYVPRNAGIASLVATLESAARGEAMCSPRVAASLFRRLRELADAQRRAAAAPAEPLTAREREIAALVARGLSNKEIARELFIEVPTVKNHVHRVLEKLHVMRRGQIGAAARSSIAPLSESSSPPRPSPRT
jgi:two-component system, NarL family, nitrate/nitrite response regulator NarL